MSAPSWLKSFAKSKKPKPAPEKSETAPAPPSQAPTDQHVEDYQQISADDYVQMIEGAGVALPKKRAAPSTDAERAGKQNKPSMREALQEGLSNPLAEDNVGFRMLAKMGFKSGQGLGKDAAGTAQPLDVRMRGRSGLGVEEEKIRKQKEELRRQEEEMRRQVEEVAEMRASFVSRNKAQFRAQQVARDLNKAKQLCESLDRAAGVTQSDLWHQEPASPPPAASSAEDNGRAANALKAQLVEQEFTTAGGEVFYRAVAGGEGEREVQRMPCLDPTVEFEKVVQHLRTAHRYCFFCGGRFDSEVQLVWHCEQSEECAQLLGGEAPRGDDWDGLGD